jgi:ribosome biogenesis protein Nip4
MANEFRESSEFEKKLILQALETISAKLKSYIRARQHQLFLLIPKGEKNIIYPQVFFIPESIIKIIHQIQEIANIREAGVYLGFIKRGKFHLSIEGAELFTSLQLIKEKEMFVLNQEGTKAILYGNNIKKKMVKSFPDKLEKDMIYFTLSPSKELIALGLSLKGKAEVETLGDKKEIVLNLIDKGYYLRQDQ